MSEKKMVNKDGYCYVCGGKGLLDKVCPSCGRQPKNKGIDYSDEETTLKFVEKIDRFGVPAPYRGVFWNAEVLRKHNKDKEQNPAFQRFVSQLEKIHNVFAAGMMSPKSAIIVAPAGYSKEIFAYSCMQLALSHGLSVAPYLDTIELKRVLVLAGENPSYKLFGKLDYDSYLMSDVCFITVTKLPQREWAYNVIQEILGRRSRRGLSTFIISRFGLDEISRKDQTNQFSVVSTADSVDDYKYPAVISYRPIRR